MKFVLFGDEVGLLGRELWPANIQHVENCRCPGQVKKSPDSGLLRAGGNSAVPEGPAEALVKPASEAASHPPGTAQHALQADSPELLKTSFFIGFLFFHPPAVLTRPLLQCRSSQVN